MSLLVGCYQPCLAEIVLLLQVLHLCLAGTVDDTDGNRKHRVALGLLLDRFIDDIVVQHSLLASGEY